MAIKLADAYVAITGRSDGLERELNRQRTNINSWVRNIGAGVAQGLGQALFHSVANGIRTGLRNIDDAINKASDLQESINKVSVVFGDSSREIIEWSRTSSKALGQSQQQALEAAGTFGNMLTSMGTTREEAGKMSVALVELASDLASFNNIDPSVALEKLRSGIAGELEPVRTLGIDLSELRVQAKALELGLAETTKEITQQDKVLARYQIIMEQTKNSQGDFARTSDELANSQRTLRGQLEDAAATLGQFFLPVRLAFVRGLSELIDVVAPYGENIMDSLAAGLARGIIAILPVLQQVRALFTYWLKPGSPPRLLKELTQWGAGAMQAYLEGWSSADFNALREAGSMIEQVVRSFAGSGDIAETDLVNRIFGTQRGMVQAINDFRTLGFVSEATLNKIADAAGPAGRQVAGLVQEYFDLQRATERVTEAQDELNSITDRYAQALNPLDRQLEGVRRRQQEIRENQRLEELGEIIRDPRADADERQLARLEAEEIQLERQARAIESERDAAVDAAQEKLNAARREEDAQRAKYTAAQEAMEQQMRVNALVEEEASLRERLANEALAAQERAIRELEAAQREAEQKEKERLAGLERIADAQLRYQLATTDTAGQLALMQAELGKVAEGSAEYYDILTQIANLEERLQKERDSGGGLFGPIVDVATGGNDLVQASEGIQALSDALEQAFAALSGADGQQVELNPAWQGFADTLGDIGKAVKEAAPLIQSVIDLVMGKNVEGLDTTTDPFAGSWWLSGIVPGVNTIIEKLQQIRDGDWSSLWAGFKQYVNDVLERTADDEDGSTFFLYSWLKDTAIPLLEELADGEWKETWDKFASAIKGGWEAAVTFIDNSIAGIKTAVTGITSFINEQITAWEAVVRAFMEEWGFETAPWDTTPNNGTGGGGTGGFSSFQGILPNAPTLPAMAAAGDTNNTYYIEQHIATNSDFGGARQGALEGIRSALLDRRLQGA